MTGPHPPVAAPSHPARRNAVWPLHVGMAVAGTAAVVASASTLAGLAAAAGWAGWTPWLLPAALDVGGCVGGWCWLRPATPARARGFGRTVALVGAGGTLVGNAAGHLITSGYATGGPGPGRHRRRRPRRRPGRPGPPRRPADHPRTEHGDPREDTPAPRRPGPDPFHPNRSPWLHTNRSRPDRPRPDRFRRNRFWPNRVWNGLRRVRARTAGHGTPSWPAWPRDRRPSPSWPAPRAAPGPPWSGTCAS